MKRFAALLAIVAMTIMMGSAAGAQDGYAPPSHAGDLAADGSLTLNFAGTAFEPGTAFVISDLNGNVLVSGTVPADGGVLVLPDANSIAGQAVVWSGTSTTGTPISTTTKVIAPVATPTPIPAPVVVPAAPAPAPIPSIVIPHDPAPAPKSAATPLAVTGSETSVPVLIGSGMIAVGGLAILASRKRAEQI